MPAAERSSPAPSWGVALSPRWATAFDFGSVTVLATVLAIVLATFRDYGITWDETWHLVYGDHILSWFLTFGADTSALCYRIDYMYGGGFDLLGALARRVSPLSEIETIHLLGALIGVLGLGGAFSLARRLGGPVAGFAAVLLLATTPVYFGHMFNNPKDLPFAVGYVWAMDALCDVVLRMPKVPRRSWIRFAVFAGLAMSVRIAGILLLVYLAATVIGLAILRARATGNTHAGLQTARRLGIPAAWSMMGAWVVMLASWPWALLDPIRRPWMALGRMSRFTVHRRKMPFAGEDMLTTEPRWDYLTHYFGLKLPILVLLLVFAAVVVLAIVLLRRRRTGRALDRTKRNLVLVLAASIMAPPTYAIVVSSVVYDGLRHFLFLVPVMVAVAGVMVVVLRQRSSPRATLVVSLVIAVGGGVLVAQQIRSMRQIHPYQYVYFNEIIGGLAGADGNYDTDYYGTSYKEGFRALAEHLWQTERESFLDTRYLVTGCIPDFIAANYVERNFAWVERGKKGAEFYLGYTRANCHKRYKKRPEILSVQRMETVLLIVRDLRKGGKLEEDEAEADRPEPRRMGRENLARPRKHRPRARPRDRPSDRPDDQEAP